MVLKEKVKDLPKKPGVYIMKDSMDNIIYIGKSKSLKNRVSQYFQSSKNHTNKIIKMIGNIDSFDYIVTDTELDALLLECKLIKSYKPMFNKQMKNEKTYPYIKLTVNDEFPTISITYEDENEEGKYFGPYTSLSIAEKIIVLVNDKYPIRRCSTPAIHRGSSGCLNYHLGKCMGCCRSDVDKTLYRSYIDKVSSLLSGNDTGIIKEMEEKMKEASESLDFQKAAKYRDELLIIKHIICKEKTLRQVKSRRNILAIENIDKDIFKLFFIKGNKVLYSRVISVREEDRENRENIMFNTIKCLILKYFTPEDKAGFKVTKEDVAESHIIYSYLRSNKNNIQSIVIPLLWLKETNRNKLNISIRKITKKACNM